MKSSKGATLPKEKMEKTQPKSPCCGMKYTEGSNPENLDKARAGLASYAKSHKAKH